MEDAYIYDAVRSPRGKGRKDGSLHEVTAAQLSADMLNAWKNRNNLEGHAVEDVIWGNVTQLVNRAHVWPEQPFWRQSWINQSQACPSTAFVHLVLKL